jgi:hypothetical protein
VDLSEFGEQADIAKGSVVALWAVGVGVQLAVLVVRWREWGAGASCRLSRMPIIAWEQSVNGENNDSIG